MRFLERAIKALGYHRRPYIAAVVVSCLFTIFSMVISTAAQLNLTTKNGFKIRLKQFDTSAVKSADHLISLIQEAYGDVSGQYLSWWWLGVALLAMISLGFALYLAHHRQSETNAYLLIGKSSADIISQYLLENLAVFIVGFGVAWVLLMCLTGWLDQLLVKLNAALLDAQLSNQVSATSFAKLTKQLFAHRITDFSGDGLVVPHRGPRPDVAVLAGMASTLLSGLLAVAVPQAFVYAISVWRCRLRLRRH